MGSAVLLGLLKATFSVGKHDPAPSRITAFTATTKSLRGAEKLQKELGPYAQHVKVLVGDNQAAVEGASIVVLGLKPLIIQDALRDRDFKSALQGKLVISLIAGFTAGQIQEMLAEDAARDFNMPHVAKTVPNVAARYRESMTIIEDSEFTLPAPQADLVKWIFDQVGSSRFVPADQVNNAGMLITNALAALSIPVEGLLDGSVVGGLRRSDAMELAIQGIRGLASMLEDGMHPGAMRESISSPKGATIQSLVTLEQVPIRGVFAQAQVNGTNHLKPNSK